MGRVFGGYGLGRRESSEQLLFQQGTQAPGLFRRDFLFDGLNFRGLNVFLDWFFLYVHFIPFVNTDVAANALITHAAQSDRGVVAELLQIL